MDETLQVVDETRAPFDTERLDRLMEEAGIDVLLATSRHNNRYLMGGYSFLFFSVMDAIGHSRYLPVVIYAKGRPDRAAYVGHGMEKFDNAVRPFWTPAFYPTASSTTDAAVLAVEHLAKIGAGGRPDRRSSRGSCPRTRRRCWRRGWGARGSSMPPACWSGCGR